MRSSFIKDKHVQGLFRDPDIAWDAAASMNNDGALYILENLADVANQMDLSREQDFADVLSKVKDSLSGIMRNYYVSTDADELLESNIRKAKSIFREMDFTCNADNYYFGHLIQALQISEPESYKVVHKVMQSSEINAKVNDFKDYEIIRSSCKNSGYSIDDAKDDAER